MSLANTLRLHEPELERAPEFSDEAEQAVLSAVLIDPEALRVAQKFVDETMFSVGNRKLFAAMRELAENGAQIDPITLHESLVSTGQIGVAGGKDYIGYLMDVVPTAANVEYHAKIVRGKAHQRQIYRINSAANKEIAEGVPIAAVLRRQQLALSDLDVFAAAPRRYEFLDDDGLEGLTDPAWVIDGFLPDRGLFEIHGKRGEGKGFLVLDIGLSVQTGLPFHGRAVKRGQFVYVSVEGAAGLKLRRQAWVNARKYGAATGALFMTIAVQLMKAEQVAAFIRDLRARTQKKIAIVVFDTLAKCMVGGDENNAKDMGLFIQGAEAVQRELDCLVGIVHHVGRNGDEERGSTALGGAADAMFKVSMSGKSISVQCTKMKDHDDDITLAFELEPEARSGSMVLTSKIGWELSDAGLTGPGRALLELLSRSFPGESPSTSAWLKASGLPDSTFYRLRGELVKGEYVVGRKEGRGTYNDLCPKGNEVLTPNSQITPRSLPESSPAITTTNAPFLEGGSSESGCRYLTATEEAEYFAQRVSS